jgi:hypothetical protein
MKLTVQLVIEPGDGSKVVTEVTTLERETLTDATPGLTLAESKTILAGIQEVMAAQQAAVSSAAQEVCPACGASRRRKGHHQIVVRSLFGTLRLDSPRFRRCACQPGDGPHSSSRDHFKPGATPPLEVVRLYCLSPDTSARRLPAGRC